MTERQNILIWVGIGAALAAAVLVVFFLGVFLGSRGYSLPRSFFDLGGRRSSQDFFPRDFGHGALGNIESLGENTFVVRDRAGTLKTILVDGETQIRRGHSRLDFSQLQVGQAVVVLGEPVEAEGAIKARLIRLMGMGNLGKEASGSGLIKPFRFRYLTS